MEESAWSEEGSGIKKLASLSRESFIGIKIESSVLCDEGCGIKK
ncbi:hypothetical protein [Labilibaculum antarcticum]|nr:hypothetical protein [Labilibaculum antarcticum]